MTSKETELLALLPIATSCIYAGLAAARLARAGARRERVACALLVLLCIRAVLAWPNCASPERFPVSFVWMLLPVMSILLAEARRRGATRSAGYALQAATGGLVTVCCGYALRSLLSARSGMGGIDFFAYLCFARDWLHGATGTGADARFLYFPGVYVFWRAALSLGHESLASLQWWCTLLVAMGGVLCATVVFRAARSWGWAAVAGSVEVIVALNFEATQGMTEPLAALPALAGVAAWGGAPLRARPGLLRAAALGAGLGTSIYCKQQAALLSLGFAGLLAANLGFKEPAGNLRFDTGPKEPSARDEWRVLVAVPAFAIAVLAMLFGLEGGWSALRAGLSFIGAYQANGSLVANLWNPQPMRPLLFSSAAAALVLVSTRTRDRSWRAACFLLASGAGGLLQFSVRGYPHYALLPIPMLLAGIALSGHLGYRFIKSRTNDWFLWRGAPFMLLAWLIASFATHSDLPLLSLGLGKTAALREWPYGFPAADALSTLKVPPGTGALVLPPEHAAVHFLLGTRASGWREAYFWANPAPREALEAVRDPAVRLVVQRLPLLEYLDVPVCPAAQCAEAAKALPSLGYVEVLRTEDASVWRR